MFVLLLKHFQLRYELTGALCSVFIVQAFGLALKTLQHGVELAIILGFVFLH